MNLSKCKKVVFGYRLTITPRYALYCYKAAFRRDRNASARHSASPIGRKSLLEMGAYTGDKKCI